MGRVRYRKIKWKWKGLSEVKSGSGHFYRFPMVKIWIEELDVFVSEMIEEELECWRYGCWVDVLKELKKGKYDAKLEFGVYDREDKLVTKGMVVVEYEPRGGDMIRVERIDIWVDEWVGE